MDRPAVEAKWLMRDSVQWTVEKARSRGRFRTHPNLPGRNDWNASVNCDVRMNTAPRA